jgi:hypothetical protein
MCAHNLDTMITTHECSLVSLPESVLDEIIDRHLKIKQLLEHAPIVEFLLK